MVLHLPGKMVGRKVGVIAFAVDEPAGVDKPVTHYASEATLAKDWLTTEEDAAWQDL